MVGASGAGKSSLLWNPLRAAGPMIRDRLLRLWMIDLKGGTETDRGEALFHRWATTLDDAVELLTDFRDSMLARQQRMREQHVRRCEITAETPVRAADRSTSWRCSPPTATAARVREALRLLAEVLTQGRAADHGVAAYVQEPTKDVVDVRDLFDTRICLGVTTASHVDMALGEGARDRGALADEIPGDPHHAGIGFVIDPITRLPIRFRAGRSPTPTSTTSPPAAPPAPTPADQDGRRRDGEVVPFPTPTADTADDTDERRQRHADSRHRHRRRGAGVMNLDDHRRRHDQTATLAAVLVAGLGCAGALLPVVEHADHPRPARRRRARRPRRRRCGHGDAAWLRERREDAADAARRGSVAGRAHAPPVHPGPARYRGGRSGDWRVVA